DLLPEAPDDLRPDRADRRAAAAYRPVQPARLRDRSHHAQPMTAPAPPPDTHPSCPGPDEERQPWSRPPTCSPSRPGSTRIPCTPTCGNATGVCTSWKHSTSGWL